MRSTNSIKFTTLRPFFTKTGWWNFVVYQKIIPVLVKHANRVKLCKSDLWHLFASLDWCFVFGTCDLWWGMAMTVTFSKVACKCRCISSFCFSLPEKKLGSYLLGREKQWLLIQLCSQGHRKVKFKNVINVHILQQF